MNEFSSDIIKEILKFLTYKDVLTNKYMINKEFYYALNYNDLWKCFYNFEYFEDSINRKENDPFKELFYIRYIEKKKNKYIDLPKSAQEQFLDMEASLLTLKEYSLNRFHMYDLYHYNNSNNNNNNRNNNNNYSPCNNSLNISHINHNKNVLHTNHSFSFINPHEVQKNSINSMNELANSVCIYKEINENSLNTKIQLTYEDFPNKKGDIHICSFKQCEFQYIQKNNLYICLKSKNFHVCDDKCELSIFSDIDWGYLVCPLSGKMYDYLSHVKSGNSFLRVRNNINFSLKDRLSNLNENSFLYYSDEEKNEIEESEDQEMEHPYRLKYYFFKEKKKKNKKLSNFNVNNNNTYRKTKKKEEPENYSSSYKSNLFKKILNSCKNKKKDHKKDLIYKI